jgi:hypothetical protein
MADFAAGDSVNLGSGVAMRAVDVSGEAREARRSPNAGTSVRDAASGAPAAYLRRVGADEAAEMLDPALSASGMRLHTTIDLPRLNTSRARTTPQVRGGRAEPHLRLSVNAPAQDEAQVMLEVDGTGHLRWHLPRADDTDQRRAVGKQLFDIPIDRYDLGVSTSDVTARGVVGFGLRKVLHLLRFPVERGAGWVAEQAVRWWEGHHRRPALRVANADGTAGDEVDANGLALLGGGPYLLFVHGTFSTGAAFTALHPEFGQWHRHYEGRLLVFDHPSVATSPEVNARWLLDRLPDDRSLTFDVVTHSRGGLVARQLVRQPASDQVRIRRLVQVASPNAGTVLASPRNLGRLVDTFTNLLSFVPDGTGADALQAVLEVVKQLATGALSGLDGLAAMDPDDETLRTLNEIDCELSAVHAITADFEPAPGSSLAQRSLDVITDAMFGAANDLVVPTAGMSNAGKFVVSDPYVVAGPTVAHSGYFGDERVRTEIRRCLDLPPALPFR